MASRPEIERMVGVLREVLKRRGLRYREVASALDISLPTVKRLFADGTMDMERVLALADWLGLGFYELVELSRSGEENEVRFTPEEEEFFALNPGYLGFFMALKGGAVTPSQVADLHKLSTRSEKKYVQRLEAMGLVDRTKRGDVVVMRRGTHFVWDNLGPLGRGYARFFIQEMAALATNLVAETPPAEPTKIKLVTGSKFLTAAEREEFAADLENLVTKYRQRSAMNHAGRLRRDVAAQTVSYMFITDVWKDNFFDEIGEI